ncbi:hypothetical protein EYF80_037822 [Liparis tanakae]|uniref:Uncharacterized protein n=1 Tax=Liparis tanakae TaxID=230148 RepID=A0A4Z2GH35_9TELE|nr:hypothetical protein EYF80_037822 [Liparis tanakae]
MPTRLRTLRNMSESIFMAKVALGQRELSHSNMTMVLMEEVAAHHSAQHRRFFAPRVADGVAGFSVDGCDWDYENQERPFLPTSMRFIHERKLRVLRLLQRAARQTAGDNEDVAVLVSVHRGLRCERRRRATGFNKMRVAESGRLRDKDITTIGAATQQQSMNSLFLCLCCCKVDWYSKNHCLKSASFSDKPPSPQVDGYTKNSAG